MGNIHGEFPLDLGGKGEWGECWSVLLPGNKEGKKWENGRVGKKKEHQMNQPDLQTERETWPNNSVIQYTSWSSSSGL